MLTSVGYALLGNGVVAAGLALASVFMGRRRGVYLAGLFAAVIAYLIALPVGLTLRALFPEGVPSAILPFVDPAIEEPLRIFFLGSGATVLLRSGHTTGAAIAFAFGYALFEVSIKAFDLIASYAGEASAVQTLIILSLPLVVLGLHVTLSLLAALMFVREIDKRAILWTTFALHAAHNASVLWLPHPDDFDTLGLLSVLRLTLFVAAIWYSITTLATRDSRVLSAATRTPGE